MNSNNGNQILSFEESVLIEQVREAEEKGLISPNNTALRSTKSSYSSFEDWLRTRANLIASTSLSDQDPEHARSISRYITLIFIALALFAGGLATNQALSTPTLQLNIYWLLMVLLGFNYLSLFFWFTGLCSRYAFKRPLRKKENLLSNLWRKIETFFLAKNDLQSQLDKTWLKTTYNGEQRIWYFSAMTHGLWIVYLTSGFLIFTLMLMTQQFDFVWGTTLLSTDVFIHVTQVLAAPLEIFGLSGPTHEQILNSQLDEAATHQGSLRQAWALFLLGCIALYGIAPRIALFGITKAIEKWHKSKFSLDLSRPYYIKLHNQYMPAATEGLIVDPDPSQNSITEKTLECNATSLPEKAICISIELSNQHRWPSPYLKTNQIQLEHIIDKSSLNSMLEKLHEYAGNQLIICVSSTRAPDRGIKRIMRKLINHSSISAQDCWLAILPPSEKENLVAEERILEWQSHAAQCGLPTHQTVLLDNAHLGS